MEEGKVDAAAVYRQVQTTVEDALTAATQAQWEGRNPDLHRERRALIELRHRIPNDRADVKGQVMRDLITTYAAVLEEQQGRDRYERGAAVGESLAADLARLRTRAGRFGIAVLTDDLKGFKVVRSGPPADRPARPAPAGQGRPPARGATGVRTQTAPAGASDGGGRRRRRPRPSGGVTPPTGQ